MESDGDDPDPHAAFTRLERAAWGRRARGYRTTTARATTQAIPALLAALRVRQGMRLIDLCTGPGYTAACAAVIGADVSGIDHCAAMIEEARHSYPGLDFAVGDAEDTGLAGESVGAVACNFGVPHLASPDAMIAEAARLLRPGGHLAFSQWVSPAESPLQAALHLPLRAHGDLSGLPTMPDPFRFSDLHVCREALAGAGLTEIAFTEVPCVLEAPAEGIVDFLLRVEPRVAMVMEAQDARTAAVIRREIEASLARHRYDDLLAIPAPAFVASAVKP